MAFEDTLRNVALTLIRFSVFAGGGIVFGTLPVLLGVVRPALVGAPSDRAARVGARIDSFVRIGVLAVAFGTALGLLVQVTLVSQVTGSELGAGDLESVLGTSFGRWQALRLPLAAAMWLLVCPKVARWGVGPISPGTRRRMWWVTWGVLGLALLITNTMSGHAAVSSPRPVALLTDAVHLAAGATWFAGVVTLCVLLPDAWRRRGSRLKIQVLATAVSRFSRVALVSIGIVAVTGTINSFMNLATWSDLVTSSYGRTLLAKIALFGLILLLGGINHFFVRRRLERALSSDADSAADAIFRKTIAVELAVAVAILLITGLLVGLARTRPSVALGSGQRVVAVRSNMPPSVPNAAASASAMSTAPRVIGAGDGAPSSAPARTMSSGLLWPRSGGSPPSR